MEPLPTYRLIVRAEGKGPPVPVRLRRFVKWLLRGFGVRVLSIEEVKPAVAPAQVDAGERKE